MGPHLIDRNHAELAEGLGGATKGGPYIGADFPAQLSALNLERFDFKVRLWSLAQGNGFV